MKTDSISKRIYLMSDRQLRWLKTLVDRACAKRGIEG